MLPRFRQVATLLVDATEELFAFTAFPKEHWRRIWSNNPQERLNREIRRRTNVFAIFPNREAITSLVAASMCEAHDPWAVVRRYVSYDSPSRNEISVVEVTELLHRALHFTEPQDGSGSYTT